MTGSAVTIFALRVAIWRASLGGAGERGGAFVSLDPKIV